MRLLKNVLIATMSFGLAGVAFAQKTDQPNPTNPAATSDQKQADRDMTAKIRKSIMDDKSLSTSAHNVNIRTKDGSVTLRGKVNSDEEKTTVESKAKELAGASNVTSEITVAPKKKAG